MYGGRLRFSNQTGRGKVTILVHKKLRQLLSSLFIPFSSGLCTNDEHTILCSAHVDC